MGSLVNGLRRWLEEHPTALGMPLWLALLLGSVAMAAASVLVTIVAVVRIPHDYFRGVRAPDWSSGRHPLIRALLRIARNLIGVGLVLLGIVLSLPGIPGQGLLTILLGLMMVDFPGKRRLEQRLARRPRVRRGLDAIRTRYGRRALEFDENAR